MSEEARIQDDSKCLIITKQLLDVNAATAFLSSPCCGGVSLFLGCTRESEEESVLPASHDGRSTVAASYLIKG